MKYKVTYKMKNLFLALFKNIIEFIQSFNKKVDIV